MVLPRELVAGEVLAVPLVFSGGALNTDFTLAFKAAYAGVSFDWTTTAWSTLTFTGPSVAEANLVMTALADGDTADDLMRVSIPTSSSTGNPRLTATNLGGGARGVSRTSWGLTVRDDDAGGTPGLIESAGRLNLVEGGPPGGYKVRLRTQPAGAVTVTASSESPQTFRVHAAGGTPGASATLTFSPTDWNRPREVTVTTREDADAADAMLTIAHAVTGTGDYAAISPDPITVFVVDDEGETRLPSAPPTGGGGPGGGGGGPAPPPPGPPPPPPPPPPGPPPSTGPPDASFTVAGADCEGDLCVTFTGVPTTLSDTSAGAVVARAWDTGDGRRSPSAVLRYVWTEPGYYRVTLRVSGSGTDSEAHRTFLVRPAEPAGRCVPERRDPLPPGRAVPAAGRLVDRGRPGRAGRGWSARGRTTPRCSSSSIRTTGRSWSRSSTAAGSTARSGRSAPPPPTSATKSSSSIRRAPIRRRSTATRRARGRPPSPTRAPSPAAARPERAAGPPPGYSSGAAALIMKPIIISSVEGWPKRTVRFESKP